MRLPSRAAVAALVLAAPGFSIFAQPVRAQQTGVRQEYEDMKNALGLGADRPPVDYTERAPLVVPPSYTLPPPGGADPERLGVNDPDVVARRKALTDSRRPVPPTDPGAYAKGRMGRAYLVDPPSGMRDPDAVAADISHDGSEAAGPVGEGAGHGHKHRRKAAQQ